MLRTTLGEVMKSGIGRVATRMWCLLKENMMKVRVLLGVLAVLVLVGSATGCGLVSDQTKQDAKNKVESKAKQAKQEIKKKVETGQEDLKKKVDGVQKDINELQEKVDEILKKVDAHNPQDQKAK